MKRKTSQFVWLLVCLLPVLPLPLTAETIFYRTYPRAHPNWIDTNIQGSTYIQLVVAGASVISPEVDFIDYTDITLTFKARTYYGGSKVENEITVDYTTDNGESWTEIGKRCPTTNVLKDMPSFSLTGINSSTVRIRLSVGGKDDECGVGISAITLTGRAGQKCILALYDEGRDATVEGFPLIDRKGTQLSLPRLPDEGDWHFAGWDSNPDVQEQPAYPGGAIYTLTSNTVNLHAIYRRHEHQHEQWTRVSSLADITDGTYLITNGDYYLPGMPGNSGFQLTTLRAENVFVTGDRLNGKVPFEARWTLTGTASSVMLQSPVNATYLHASRSPSEPVMGTDATSWIFEVNKTGFSMRSSTDILYCAAGESYGKWKIALSKSNSVFSTNDGILQLYRLSNPGTTHYSGTIATTCWTGTSSCDWNDAGNWSRGVPGTTTTAFINSGDCQPEISTPITVAALVLQPTAELSIVSAGQLTITGDLTLRSSLQGTATLLNEGSLQVEGKSRVEQVFTSRSEAEASDFWWYFSPPVAGSTSSTLLQPESGNRMGYYCESSATYPQFTDGGQVLEAGRGYVAALGSSGVYTFSGQLHDGTVGPLQLTCSSSAGSQRGFNLIGNPYPSYLDWNAVIGYGSEQSRRDIRPTIWLRTRTAAGTMVFDTFDGEYGTSLGVQGQLSRYIPPLQAFWVKVCEESNSAALQFTNAHRVSGRAGQRNGQLRTAPIAARAYLKLEVRKGADRDETIIATHPEARDGYDYYDSGKMNTGGTEICTVVDHHELVINKRKSLAPGTLLQLGLRPVEEGSYSLQLTGVEGLDSMSLVLIDTYLSTETPLALNASYTFTSDARPSSGRFWLEVRKRIAPTGIIQPQSKAFSIHYASPGQLTVHTDTYPAPLYVFTSSGQLLHSEEIRTGTTNINLSLSAGIYLINYLHQHHKLVIP